MVLHCEAVDMHRMECICEVQLRSELYSKGKATRCHDACLYSIGIT